MKHIYCTLLTVTLLTGCASLPAAKSDGTVAAKTFLACEQVSIQQTVLSEVTRILAEGLDTWRTLLDDLGTKYGTPAESCAVQAAVAAFENPKPTTSGLVAEAPSAGAARARALIAERGWVFLK